MKYSSLAFVIGTNRFFQQKTLASRDVPLGIPFALEAPIREILCTRWPYQVLDERTIAVMRLGGFLLFQVFHHVEGELSAAGVSVIGHEATVLPSIGKSGRTFLYG